MHELSELPLKGFIETSFVDWPGKICAVVFFPLCNFRCRYCHNADLVLSPDTFETIAWGDIVDHLERHRGWIDGVCISGGEPTLQPSLRRVCSAVKELGFLVKLDTNGSSPDLLAGLIAEGLVDYVAMDVKSCLDEHSYCKITGAPNMSDAVSRSVRLLLDSAVQYEFRVTVVPTYHGPEEIYQIARELNGAQRLRIQNFNPSRTMLDPSLKNLQPFSDEEISTFQAQVDRLISLQT